MDLSAKIILTKGFNNSISGVLLKMFGLIDRYDPLFVVLDVYLNDYLSNSTLDLELAKNSSCLNRENIDNWRDQNSIPVLWLGMTISSIVTLKR